jgi:hypothetical protein
VLSGMCALRKRVAQGGVRAALRLSPRRSDHHATNPRTCVILRSGVFCRAEGPQLQTYARNFSAEQRPVAQGGVFAALRLFLRSFGSYPSDVFPNSASRRS